MNKTFNRIVATGAVLATVGATLLQGGIAQAADIHVTSMKDVLTRIQVDVPAGERVQDVGHDLSIAIPASYLGADEVMTVSYADFTLADDTIAVAGCTDAEVALDGDHDVVVTAPAAGCGAVTIHVTGFKATNPTTTGVKTVTVTGPDAQVDAFNIIIVDKDQIGVTASVDPTLTFLVGADTEACSGTFATSGGTVALGTLPMSRIVSSDVLGVKHICTKLSTNATHGTVVTVRSVNAGLLDGTNLIASADGLMAIGDENYGLCLDDVNSDAPNAPTPDAGFASSCLTGISGGTVSAVTDSAQPIWSVSGAAANAFQSIEVKAAISSTTPAGTNYADTLIFVATGTF